MKKIKVSIKKIKYFIFYNRNGIIIDHDHKSNVYEKKI